MTAVPRPAMPNPIRTLFPALRFCGSCCVTLGCWALWLVLSASLAVLVYIATTKNLTVPSFVLQRLENRLAQANLSLQIGRTQLDPTGKILLQDVQIRALPYHEPVLTSRVVFIHFNFWSALGLQQLPEAIELEGATLQLPAMLSPSGTPEPLLRDLSLTLRPGNKTWRVDQFTGRVGPMIVTAEGSFILPARPPGTPPPEVPALVRRFLQHGRQFALDIHQLDALEAPALALRLASSPDTGNTLALRFTARSVRQPGGLPLQLDSLALTGAFPLDGPSPRSLRLHATAASATYQDLVTTRQIRATLSAAGSFENFSFHLRDAWLALGEVTAEGETALGPLLHADLRDWPGSVAATTALQLSGEFLSVEADVHWLEKSAQLTAAGRGDPGFIKRVLGRHMPRAAPFFLFDDPVDFTAGATFTPGWKFTRLESRVATGRIDSRGVKIASARGRVDIAGMDFLAHDARVTMDDGQYAHGSYGMNFSTTVYRMLLEGRLRPTAISGWFNGNWWEKFWTEHFAFPVSGPVADVDVQGRWREPARTLFYGQGTATAARVWGGDFEEVHALVFLRPHFTHIIDCLGLQAGGTRRLSGSLKRFTDPTTRETSRLEFDARGNLDPETYRHMLGGIADDIVDSLKFSTAPFVEARGFLAGQWPKLTPDFTFHGQTTSPLHYHGFPLDHAQVRGQFTAAGLELSDITFGLAGGRGQGHLTLDQPPKTAPLGFNFMLEDADMVGAIRALETYQANRTGEKTTSDPDSKFIKQVTGGHLSLSLSAHGKPDDLLNLNGNGNAALTGAELGEIHLFGLLSQMLSGLSLNFSSLKLDAVHTSFKMNDGHLWFPDMKITGPNSVIDAKGDVTLATKTLDFIARFKPYEENRNLLTAAIGLVINPLTSILELKLTGPLSKPNWSFVVGPSSHQPTQTPVTQPAAPAPLPPETSPR